MQNSNSIHGSFTHLSLCIAFRFSFLAHKSMGSIRENSFLAATQLPRIADVIALLVARRIRDQVNTLLMAADHRNFAHTNRATNAHRLDANLFCANRARSSFSWTLHYFQNWSMCGGERVCRGVSIYLRLGTCGHTLEIYEWLSHTVRYLSRARAYMNQK